MNNSGIFVTKPLLPELNTLYQHLEDIWNSGWVTNMGAKHNELEARLEKELKVQNLVLFNNGTSALMTALKAMELPAGSEVITTAFTFAATSHCISWNGLKPVFCDIKPDDFTIDVNKIEKLITPATSAILGVHVYGFPCDTEKIQSIADKYHLKVIYDAAHAFSTEINGKGIGEYGDITMFSFHATKLYNTIEGGCLTFSDSGLREKICRLRNFGIRNENVIEEIGINGKMNELQAAVGLANLNIYKEEQKKRQAVKDFYNHRLSGIQGIRVPRMAENTTDSYQYYPIVVEKEYPLTRDELCEKFRLSGISVRKYFFPACMDFKCYKDLKYTGNVNLSVVNDLKHKVLCLPFYGTLKKDELDLICNIMTENREYGL